MKKVFIRNLEKVFEFDDLLSISIENGYLLREIILELDDQILLSDEDEELSISKDCLLITDVFNINLNDKKIINTLYKSIINDLNEKQSDLIRKINVLSLELLNDIAFESDFELDYNPEINIQAIFSNYSLCFKEVETNNYIEKLLELFRVNKVFLGKKVIITINLLDIMCDNEIKLLSKELKLLNMSLVDFCVSNNSKVKKIIVDSDYCIL